MESRWANGIHRSPAEMQRAIMPSAQPIITYPNRMIPMSDKRISTTNQKYHSNSRARTYTRTRCHRTRNSFVVYCSGRFNKFSSIFSEQIEEFDGYQYPKPAIPFPFPTTTNNPDAESLPTDSARLRKG